MRDRAGRPAEDATPSLRYDCDLSRPEGTHRFAAFFRVEDGRIIELRLLFDATEYRKLA